MNLKPLTTALAFAVLAFGSPALQAQNTAPAPEQQQRIQINDTELRQFMQASTEVAKVREDYTQRLNQVDDQNIAQQLQQEAQDKMIGAVKMLGLEVDRYNELAEQVRSSPELQARIRDMQ